MHVLSDGFELRQKADIIAVRWADIARVATFKRDLMTVDMICLAFETDAAAFEVNEEMLGFDAVAAAMNAALGLDPDWKLRVMFPAFETNVDMIFDRDRSTQ